LKQFDSSMAIDILEDALQAVSDPVGRGIAIGLCSAFYLCDMLTPAEWERYQERILEGSNGESAAATPAGTPPLQSSPTPPPAPPQSTAPLAKTRSV